MKSHNKIHVVIIALLVLVIVSQMYIIFRAMNPLNDIAVATERNLIEKISKDAGVTAGEFQFMAELGKGKGFEDVAKLQKLSRYNEEVYKDAKVGDRAVAFASKMVLYRPSSAKIIYQGETPGQKQLKDQQAVLTKVVEKVKAAGYLAASSTEVPQIATVNNIDQLKGNALYAGAENGDLVLIFNNAGVVVTYSAKGDKVINGARTQLVPLAPAEPTIKK
ncbi:MAG: hypothetical protein WCO78_04755 [Candidatus Roizmanbacteria bacterium]